MNFNDFMKLNKEKWKANASGRKQCQASVHPVDHPFGRQLVRKGLRDLVDTKLTMSQQCTLTEKANSVLTALGGMLPAGGGR